MPKPLSVKYLGLIISEGTRALGPERIKPILNHPLSMTLKQLRGFWGITGDLDSKLWGTCPALKRLPAMRETWVRSLGQEDPLEKEMATHSSILARRIPRTEEPGGLQSTESQRVRDD